MIDTHTGPTTMTGGWQVAILLLGQKYKNRFLGPKIEFHQKWMVPSCFSPKKWPEYQFSWHLEHLSNLSIGWPTATCQWPATSRWPPVAPAGLEFALKCVKEYFSNWNKSWRAFGAPILSILQNSSRGWQLATPSPYGIKVLNLDWRGRGV